MKKSMLLLALFVFSTTTTFGKIARHNFQMNFGGGYQASFKPESITFVGFEGFFKPVYATLPGYVGHGGVASLELGYVLHSVRESGIIHGFNLMMNVNASFFPSVNTGMDVIQRSLQVRTGGYMFYSVGRQLQSGRLMFDVIGWGADYRSVSSERGMVIDNNFVSAAKDTNRGLSIVYVLPGVQYIMNNGFTVGWRNQVTLNLGALQHEGLASVSSVLSLGFTIGGGKQPWERNTTSTPEL